MMQLSTTHARLFTATMLPEAIGDEEVLYRSVPDVAGFWHPEKGTVSTAVFSDSHGVSVDRDGGRDVPTIVAAFEARFTDRRGIVSITAGDCRHADAYPVARPVDENPFHAEIHQGALQTKLTRSCIKRLRDACQVIRPPAVGR
jgi:hypothetical protein